MDGTLFFDAMLALGGLGSVAWLAYGAWLSLGKDPLEAGPANPRNPRLGAGAPETQS